MDDQDAKLRRAYESMRQYLQEDAPVQWFSPQPRQEFYRPAGAPLRPTCAPNYERRLIYYSALAGALAGTLLGLAAAWVWTR